MPIIYLTISKYILGLVEIGLGNIQKLLPEQLYWCVQSAIKRLYEYYIFANDNDKITTIFVYIVVNGGNIFIYIVTIASTNNLVL